MSTLQNHFFPKLREIKYIGKKNQISTEFINNSLFYQLCYASYKSLLDGDFHFKKELKRITNNNKILLSDENLLFATRGLNHHIHVRTLDEQINKLKYIFPEQKFEVKIIITLRKQIELITSLFAEVYPYIKPKRNRSLDKFASGFINNSNHFCYPLSLNYEFTIQRFSEAFGSQNIEILLFDQLKAEPEEYYKNWCSILDVDRIPDSFDYSAKQNVSNKNGLIYLKRNNLSIYANKVKNIILPKHKPGNAILPSYIHTLLKKTKINSQRKIDIIPDSHLIDEFSNYFYESNKKVEELYSVPLRKYGYW